MQSTLKAERARSTEMDAGFRRARLPHRPAPQSLWLQNSEPAPGLPHPRKALPPALANRRHRLLLASSALSSHRWSAQRADFLPLALQPSQVARPSFVENHQSWECCGGDSGGRAPSFDLGFPAGLSSFLTWISRACALFAEHVCFAQYLVPRPLLRQRSHESLPSALNHHASVYLYLVFKN